MLKQIYLGLFLQEGDADINIFFSIFLFIVGVIGLGGMLYNIQYFDFIGYAIGSIVFFSMVAVAVAIIENEIRIIFED